MDKESQSIIVIILPVHKCLAAHLPVSQACEAVDGLNQKLFLIEYRSI
jgi:hypothetical protein